LRNETRINNQSNLLLGGGGSRVGGLVLSCCFGLRAGAGEGSLELVKLKSV